VRAQVMTRDDSSGGWVPMDGGGLSNVSVRKRLLPIAMSMTGCVNSSIGHGSSHCSSPTGPGPPPSPTMPPFHCHSIQHEYLILGKRISDQTVVLSCTIRKDFQYNKVMPTFHHWRTGDQKFGLTFQTAADARAFDKGVRMAVEDLLDGLVDTPALRHLNSDASEDDVFMTLDLPMERSELQNSPSLSHYQQPGTALTMSPSPIPPTPTKEPHLHRIQFMQRRPPPLSTSTSSLPLLSNSIPDSSVREHSITPDQLMWQQRDQELALTRERERATKEKERQRRERDSIWSGTGGVGGVGSVGEGVLNDHIELDKESYSYVQFAREGSGMGSSTGGGGLGLQTLHSLHSLHEYSYPVMPDPASSKVAMGPRRDSLSSLKKSVHTMTSLGSNNSTVPMLPNKCNRSKKKRRGSNSSSSSTKMSISHLHPPVGKGVGRLRCKHCQDTFRPEENGRGACEYAPDCVRSTIDAVSCVSCAQCLLYHCYADAEGDFTPQPCACSCSSLGPGSGRRHHGCCIDSSPKRWFGLALLSLVVPCLWCYLPLRACYRCGVQCGCCGKPHEAA